MILELGLVDQFHYCLLQVNHSKAYTAAALVSYGKVLHIPYQSNPTAEQHHLIKLASHEIQN